MPLQYALLLILCRINLVSFLFFIIVEYDIFYILLDIVKGDLVMIPNGDRKHLLFYLGTLILDFSQKLLAHLRRMVFSPVFITFVLTSDADD